MVCHYLVIFAFSLLKLRLLKLHRSLKDAARLTNTGVAATFSTGTSENLKNRFFLELVLYGKHRKKAEEK